MITETKDDYKNQIIITETKDEYGIRNIKMITETKETKDDYKN